MIKEKKLGKHIFDFGPNGGEGLSLETTFIDNGDGVNGIYLNQILTLQSYGNSASFELCATTFTPELLRKLANELDEELAKIKGKLSNE